jgi:hypothetical protein
MPFVKKLHAFYLPAYLARGNGWNWTSWGDYCGFCLFAAPLRLFG